MGKNLREENVRLFNEYKNGDYSVREKIILANLPLVNVVLKRVKGSEREDMYQSGVEGLIRAVDTFDVTQEVPFSTYAAVCIERTIQRSIEKKSIEKVQAKIFKYSNDVYKVTGKKLSVKEISNDLDMDFDLVYDLIHTCFNACSLNDSVYTDEELEIMDELEDKRINIEREILDKVYIQEMLSILSEKNREIVKMFYGIGCVQMNIVEIGKKIGMTRQGVSFIILKSIEKIKNSSKCKINSNSSKKNFTLDRKKKVYEK